MIAFGNDPHVLNQVRVEVCRYAPGPRSEVALRAERVIDKSRRPDLGAICEPWSLDDKILASIHPPQNIELQHAAYTDTSLTDGSRQAVRTGVHCSLSTFQQARQEKRCVFTLTHPPDNEAMGECAGGHWFLTKTAPRAQSLREAKVSRVAVLDMDEHHSNAALSSVYERDEDLAHAGLPPMGVFDCGYAVLDSHPLVVNVLEGSLWGIPGGGSCTGGVARQETGLLLRPATPVLCGSLGERRNLHD